MPIQIDIEKERDLTICTLSGDVTVKDVKEALKQIWDNAELTKNLLWDTRPATFIKPMANEDIEILLAMVDGYSDRFKEREDGKTTVVAETDLGFGLMRMLDTLAEIEEFPIQPEPFRTIEEAMEYIAGKTE
jgi:hypothetical protein